jgi:hypothetical protein
MLAACGDKQERMGKGFLLPAGDIERGRQAFVELGCNPLSDIVTFLHGHYRQAVPEGLENPYYYGH